MFLANKLNKGGSLSSPDAQFNYVTMLLHGDGTNGAQNNTFLDSSTNNFTITRNGNTTQGSFSPYGSNWSNYFDGNGDYLTAPTPILSASGDFTIECWINPRTSSSNTFVLAQFISGNSGRTGFGLGGNVVQMFLGGSTNNGTTNISYNTWTHLAFTRSGTTFKAYVNGTLDLTVTSSVSIVQENTTIGGNPYYSPALDFSGYISNLRVTNTVVYTTNFTPSTTPLTAISGTQLLTCQSNRFKDNSTNNYSLAVNEIPSVQRFNPFGASAAYSTSVIGGSGYFDGTGDWLETTTSVTAFGSGNWTVEFFVYPTVSGATQIISDTRTSSQGLYPLFYINTANKLGFYLNTADRLVSTNAININTWTHVAFVKNSTTTTCYLNGVANGTYSDSNTYLTNITTFGASGLTADSHSFRYTGYLSNYRIVVGTAVYTTTFTPPTTPLSAITNTALLLSTTNGAIYDNAMMNNLETVGNAQISTSVKKYGTGSLKFDGTGDYLKVSASSVGAFGTGDFTFECWFYPLALSSDVSTLYSSNNDSATSGTLNINVFDNGKIKIGDLYETSSSVSTNAWSHIAVCRASGTLRIFINGTQGSSNSVSTSYTSDGGYIGARIVSGTTYAVTNGYIDDLRITKGYARYTATFTPPTSALSDTGPY